MASKQILPVMFRAERSGDFKGNVIAVFPGEAGSTADPWSVEIFDAREGSASATWGWVKENTRPATSAEYAALLARLRRMYGSARHGEPVQLRVIQRVSREMHDARRGMGR